MMPARLGEACTDHGRPHKEPALDSLGHANADRVFALLAVTALDERRSAGDTVDDRSGTVPGPRRGVVAYLKALRFPRPRPPPDTPFAQSATAPRERDGGFMPTSLRRRIGHRRRHLEAVQGRGLVRSVAEEKVSHVARVRESDQPVTADWPEVVSCFADKTGAAVCQRPRADHDGAADEL